MDGNAADNEALDDTQNDLRNRDSTDNEDVQFYFFYDIVEQMILKRGDVGDVCTLSSWLKALEQSGNKDIRNDYIKLMLLALEHPEPICPFKDPPPETIDPLESGVIEMSRRLLRKEGTATCTTEPSAVSNPPVSTAVSNNKCQYASSQIIPNVGTQVYYAYSDEPLYHWHIPPQISVPKSGPHAGALEWERSLAGILPEFHTPVVDNSKLLNTEDGEINTVTSMHGSRSKNSKYRCTSPEMLPFRKLWQFLIRQGNIIAYGLSSFPNDSVKENDESELCNVMKIEQQSRNVTEEFEWNDASLLTGEIIIGADVCSDRKVDVQTKTQVELDEEAASAFDKIYPGDFKIHVDQTVINSIGPTKYSMEAGDKGCVKENQKPNVTLQTKRLTACDPGNGSETVTPQRCNKGENLHSADAKNRKSGHRPHVAKSSLSAGQDNTWSSVNCSGLKDHANVKTYQHKISKQSSDLAVLMAELPKFKHLDCIEPNSPRSVDSAEDELSLQDADSAE